MNIALLSRSPDLYANQRLASAAQQRGCSVTVIDPLHCAMVFNASGIQVVHKHENMTNFAAVIPRFGPLWQRQAGAVLAQLERQGLVSLNATQAMSRARNKIECAQLFNQHTIPFPKSASIESINLLESIIESEFHFPLLLKLNNSSQGHGVALFDDITSLQRRMAELYINDEAFLIQEFLPEASGVDYRLFVINNGVVAAMKRTASLGDFRSNIHLGGQPSAHVATLAEIDLAIKATALLGLNVAGVDIIYGQNGPMILEVNACPGFEALEQVSGVDVAGEMLEFLISRIK